VRVAGDGERVDVVARKVSIGLAVELMLPVQLRAFAQGSGKSHCAAARPDQASTNSATKDARIGNPPQRD
jgi:hypothetical protein